MSLDVNGFTNIMEGGEVVIKINTDHKLLKLARQMPWNEMLQLIIPDLQRTEKKHWWMGRPLRVRIHLGVYILQQMCNLTDRAAEQQVRDNAAFRLFCGYGLLSQWHAPDHTKIEAFRSRIRSETQCRLANLISQHAVKLGYANPAELDIDSTIQEANIAYPALGNLLVKVAILASTVAKGLNTLCHEGREKYRVGLTHIKQVALNYFNLKRKKATTQVLKLTQQQLWRDVYKDVFPILNNLYHLSDNLQSKINRSLKRAVEILKTRGAMLLHNAHSHLFEEISNTSIISLHAQEVACFNKGKLNKGLQFRRAFQLGRIGGNFLMVGQCSSVYMPDAQSLPCMLRLHQSLFGEGVLKSLATDKGYYAYENEQLLIKSSVDDIQLPRPERTLNAPPPTTPWSVRKALHDRRAGIEPLIGHTKHGGQMGKSRMKSDNTTKSAGYAAVLGLNLRQLSRYISGEVCLEKNKIAHNLANINQDNKIMLNEECLA